ncbi:MAG TPA: beta-ketoacyl-ACP synthase II [Armatimonadota bacterium]|jgi:3-oxoacyl-[acyl-carrier-protein] synthase II
MRRAVLTGIGPITPIGVGKEAFWAGLQAARSGIGPITHFDASGLRSQMAGEVTGFDPAVWLDEKRLKRTDRFSQFAIVGARLALADAGLDLAQEDLTRVGVSLGSALGGIAFAEREVGVLNGEGLREVDPSLALCVFCGAGSSNIAIDLGATGPASANSNSCASGTVALGQALDCIRTGRADVVLAGGAEAPLAPLCFGAFTLLRAMSCRNDEPERACRPFDVDRDGFVMAEGASLMVMEEREHALARGAHIYAEVAGHSLTNDAYHMAAPRPDGSSAARAMTIALADADLSPRDIGYINAHGSSTPLNDKTETLAIKTVFGAHAYDLAISSTKGHHGHSLGAAGALEAAACALALDHGWLPPTVNLDTPDPECDLDYVPRAGRDRAIDALLSNSFGFGGINACVVMTKP